MNFIKTFFLLAILMAVGLLLAHCKNSNLRSDSANSTQNGQTTDYFIVREREGHENAAAALATIAHYYAIPGNIETIARLIPTRDGYASLLSLKLAAEKLGLSSRAVKGTACDALLEVNFPAIAHEQTQVEQEDKQPGHFVVIYESDRTSIVVGNTSNGVIQKRHRNQFCQTWTGFLLLIEPKQSRSMSL